MGRPFPAPDNARRIVQCQQPYRLRATVSNERDDDEREQDPVKCEQYVDAPDTDAVDSATVVAASRPIATPGTKLQFGPPR
jgi:hypothetical protein